MCLFLRAISFLGDGDIVIVNRNEEHHLSVLEPCPLLTSELLIQTVGTEDKAEQ